MLVHSPVVRKRSKKKESCTDLELFFREREREREIRAGTFPDERNYLFSGTGYFSLSLRII